MISEKGLGPDHPQLATILSNPAEFHCKWKEHARSWRGTWLFARECSGRIIRCYFRRFASMPLSCGTIIARTKLPVRKPDTPCSQPTTSREFGVTQPRMFKRYCRKRRNKESRTTFLGGQELEFLLARRHGVLGSRPVSSTGSPLEQRACLSAVSNFRTGFASTRGNLFISELEHETKTAGPFHRSLSLCTGVDQGNGNVVHDSRRTMLELETKC